MTALDDVTQTFNRPRFQQQGPDTNCTIIVNGVAHYLGWDSCSAYGAAMGEDATTGGIHRPSGCAVRRETGDVSGGLTLRQVADALESMYGTFVATYTGANVLTPARVALNLRAGRRVIAQGGAGAMVGTPNQSTAGDVNHLVMVNEGRGWQNGIPSEVLVYDPAADGRKRSYHVDQGPSWWPWSRFLKFASYLRPNGPGTPRLGAGMVYAGVFPDSEPHVLLVKGAVKAHPFPDRVRADKAPTAIHSTRGGVSTVKRWVHKDVVLRLFQYVGKPQNGLPGVWGGNDDGTEWVLLENCRHVGEAT